MDHTDPGASPTRPATANAPAPMNRRDLLAGAAAGLPRVGGVLVYGIAMGVATSAAGLTLLEASLFSALVNAGAAQFAALQIWPADITLLTLAITVATMNARYLLLGAALRPLFDGRSPVFSYASLFILYDNNWALAIQEDRNGTRPVAFFLGAGLMLWSLWMVGTITGHMFGQILGDARRYGLDFALLAFFSTLAAIFARNTTDVLPIVAAIAVAIMFFKLDSGPWYIVAGAITGCIAAAVRHTPPPVQQPDAQ